MPSIRINGKSIYYYISEPEQKPLKTLLLIHGLGSSSSYYLPVTSYVQPGIRCVAIDTPGSGLSELGNSELSIFSIVEDAIQLLNVLRIEGKVTIVGHSMGGIVASQLAVSHGSRVNAVVLIGPVNPSTTTAKLFEDRIQVVQRNGLEALALTVPVTATGASATPLHHSFVRNLILRTSSEGYASLCNAIATAEKPNYAAITVPLLIIAGSDDETAPMAGCQSILDSYSTEQQNKKIVVLSGVGHWHCIEAGELVAENIKTFVEDRSF